jgi:diaminopimelate epimerase
MEAEVVDADATNLKGVPFFKMTGSGNDFVFLDGRLERHRALETPEAIRRVCRRGTGIGADGVVWLLPATGNESFRMRYRNSDGSVADMCGNAALCSVNLAIRLGMAPADRPFEFMTDAGTLTGRRRADGLPEVSLTAVRGALSRAPVHPAHPEVRIGLANTGVPHLVVLVPDAEAVDLVRRGRELRSDPALGAEGANVNFVSRSPVGFRMRTYERGVEAETLACGTGAAACAAVLHMWGDATGETIIETTSDKHLVVSIRDVAGAITPSLAGEGRLVFVGEFGDL